MKEGDTDVVDMTVNERQKDEHGVCTSVHASEHGHNAMCVSMDAHEMEDCLTDADDSKCNETSSQGTDTLLLLLFINT